MEVMLWIPVMWVTLASSAPTRPSKLAMAEQRELHVSVALFRNPPWGIAGKGASREPSYSGLAPLPWGRTNCV
jgi:hypothetical protein